MVIQELRDYLGSEAQSLSDEAVVNKVMFQALDYQRQVGELKANAVRGRKHL